MYYIYILANKRNGTLYIGITSKLVKRVYEHKNELIKGFTTQYKINKLVYYESCEDVKVAIQREKQLKWWKRKWKLRLIEEGNPDWIDLYNEIT